MCSKFSALSQVATIIAISHPTICTAAAGSFYDHNCSRKRKT